MYVHTTVIRVPLGKMDHLRALVETAYLPVACTYRGFQSAYLLERVDDPEAAELVVFWQSHADAEFFHSSAEHNESLRKLHTPGMSIQRQGHNVRLSVGDAVQLALH